MGTIKGTKHGITKLRFWFHKHDTRRYPKYETMIKLILRTLTPGRGSVEHP